MGRAALVQLLNWGAVSNR